MKRFCTLFILLFTVASLAAQHSSMSTTETTTEEGYEFTVKVSKNRLPDLIKVFNRLTSQPENRRFSGVATQEKEGVTVSLDTRKKQLYIETEATGRASLEDAKAKADIVRKYLGSAPPPPPPAPPVRRGHG